MQDGPFYPDHGLERIVAYHERQDARYAEAAAEVSDETGKPILTATELGVTAPDNPGPAAVRASGQVLLPERRSRGARPRAHVALRAAPAPPDHEDVPSRCGADLAPVARRRGGARRARSGRRCRSGPVHPGVGADHAPHDAGAVREACGRRARAARGRGTACRRAATARGVAHRLQLSARHRERGRGHRRARHDTADPRIDAEAAHLQRGARRARRRSHAIALRCTRSQRLSAE